MPPLRKYSREDIINTSYEIIKKEGISGMNARKIAHELKCSVQPIFHNFSSMDELKKAVYNKIYNAYKAYLLENVNKDSAYKMIGLSYVKFARDYPEFFKLIFMQQTDLNAEKFMMSDTVGEDIIKAGQKLTGLSYEEQKKFHVKVWIFTHGIATLVVNGTIKINDEEIEKLLKSTVREMLVGYKKGL